MKFIIQQLYPIYTNIYKASTLPQAQRFRFMTPDPFLLRGLGLGTRLGGGEEREGEDKKVGKKRQEKEDVDESEK